MQLLTHLAVVRFTGRDVRLFLQGQLSNDLQLLTPTHALLASCNSPQGRVQAILTLIERANEIAAVLPATLIDATIARLRKYVLRSKVVIEDARLQLQPFAATRADLEAQQLPVPPAAGAHHEQNGASVLRWCDPVERFLVLTASAAIESVTERQTQRVSADETWLLADIRAGLPQVLPATHEAFVAQMLNLDALNGISFSKGCYTGQEIIARTHYRGAVKRRLFRLRAAASPPTAGTRIFANGVHAGDVVMSAATDAGCELLAVLQLAQLDHSMELESAPGIALVRLELPYGVPRND